MADFIAIDIRGIPELSKKLERIPPLCIDAICEGVADYMLNVLQLQPTPDHTKTRKQAYGTTFFTDRQRRWFFWALGTGALSLPYKRTQEMRRAWKKYGKGANVLVANETEAAVFTMDDERQARFSRLVGWKKLGDVIRARHDGIEKAAVIGMKKGLKQAGIKPD
jgi:sugar/nucleoside kinase (ribokinase family)